MSGEMVELPKNRYWLRIAVIWLIGIVAVVIVIAVSIATATKQALQQNDQYNQSVVACVQAGADPEECAENLR